MHLRLMGDRHPLSNIDGTFPDIDFHFILRHVLAALERFKTVNHGVVLRVALITDVNILSLISSNRRKGGHKHPLPKFHRADH